MATSKEMPLREINKLSRILIKCEETRTELNATVIETHRLLEEPRYNMRSIYDKYSIINRLEGL